MRRIEQSETTVAGLGGDWATVERVLPDGWQAQARALGAISRSTGLSDPSVLLRVLLIHLADGAGLRESSARAALSGLATISDVGILKRLKRCGAWFEWMAQALRSAHGAPLARSLVSEGSGDVAMATAESGRRVRLIDGTMVSEPGDTGSKWRLHYSVTLPTLSCDQVVLSAPSMGETLKRYRVVAGDIFIADRGYANPAGVAHVLDGQADVIVRTNLVTLPLYVREAEGVQASPGCPRERFDVLAHLRQLRSPHQAQAPSNAATEAAGAVGAMGTMGELGEWPVWVKVDKAGKRWIAGRLCAIKKNRAASALGEARVRRESQRNGTTLQPQTLEAAGYVFVFTTLGASYSAARVLELYRMRWQIELIFKRLKSLLGLGHLKKHDPEAARAWLQGKLLVACLIERLLALAEHISPWGFEFEASRSRAL